MCVLITSGPLKIPTYKMHEYLIGHSLINIISLSGYAGFCIMLVEVFPGSLLPSLNTECMDARGVGAELDSAWGGFPPLLFLLYPGPVYPS